MAKVQARGNCDSLYMLPDMLLPFKPELSERDLYEWWNCLQTAVVDKSCLLEPMALKEFQSQWENSKANATGMPFDLALHD